MLKNLLQTWIEAVFGAKKEWIGSQAFSADIARTGLSLSISGSFVTPSDGLFGFNANVHTFDVYCYNGKSITSRSQIVMAQANSFLVSMVIPVTKGHTVTYSFNAVPTELWFIPTAGSQ